MRYSLLPFELVKFWFIDAPLGLLAYFGSVNTSFARLFSISLMLRTFFRPIKNEYRQGLIGFSIGMGMFIKIVLLLVSLFIFIILICLEFLFITLFILLPILSFLPFFVSL